MNYTVHHPVERILEAIAKEEDVDPTEMSPPLASVVDPDALNELLARPRRSRDGTLEIRFTYRGHEVIARQNGEVELA